MRFMPGRPNASAVRSLAVLVILMVLPCTSRASSLEGVDIHGFLSQGFQGTRSYDYMANSMDGTMEYSEMGVNFVTDASDNIRVGVQLFARDLGTLGNNVVVLDWAYGDYQHSDWIGFRAGKVKMPYGFYNETRDIDALRTAVLLPQSVYDERFRDFMVAVTGAALYGASPTTVAGSLEYQTFFGTTGLDTDGSLAQAINATGLVTIQALETHHSAGAQLIWNAPIEGLRIGGTWNHFHWGYDAELAEPVLSALQSFGAQDVEFVESKNTRLLTASGEYIWENLTVSGEYSSWKGALENPYVGIDLNRLGWYGSASYRLTDWLEAGAYRAVFYNDADDKDGANEPIAHMAWQKDNVISLRFDMSTYWMFKTEIHFINGTGLVLPNEDITPEKEDWSLFTAKTSFIF